MAQSPTQLWDQYHKAITDGKMELAQAVLKRIHSVKAHGQQVPGCSNCNRRFR